MTTTNTYGRQVVIPLTNKSGGGVIAGDAVVVDTTNNDAFTTSTAGAFVGGIGIAQETIASNATGRVLLSGYAALVNVNASVTRGNFGKTYTVAKQATDAGSSRTVGTFCQFLTGGTTPDAMVYPVDLGSGSGTGTVTTVEEKDGSPTDSAVTKLIFPNRSVAISSHIATISTPGEELDYVEVTTGNVNITATTEGTANTIITANAVTFDGSTVCMIEFYSALNRAQLTAAATMTLALFEDGSSIGSIGAMGQGTTNAEYSPLMLRRRRTPASGSRTYSVRGYVSSGTGIIGGGAGGAGVTMPIYLQITRV